METVAAARPPQFKTIAEVEGTAANTLVDILGVVTVVEAATTITLRNGGEALKRALTIVDTSCKTVEVRRPPPLRLPQTLPRHRQASTRT